MKKPVKVNEEITPKTQKLSLTGVTKSQYNNLIIMLNGLGFKRNILNEVSSGEKSSKNVIKRNFCKNKEFFKFSYLPEKNKIYGVLKSSIPKWKLFGFIGDKK